MIVATYRYLPPLLSFTSFNNFLSIEDDSELSKASAESGVFPVELFGDEPSLNKLKSAVLPSEFELTMDHGLGLGAITGQDFNFSDFVTSDSSRNNNVVQLNASSHKNSLPNIIILKHKKNTKTNLLLVTKHNEN